MAERVQEPDAPPYWVAIARSWRPLRWRASPEGWPALQRATTLPVAVAAFRGQRRVPISPP